MGIDLDAVRSSVEAASGPGALDDPKHCRRSPSARRWRWRWRGLLREDEGAAKTPHDRGVEHPVSLRQDLGLFLNS